MRGRAGLVGLVLGLLFFTTFAPLVSAAGNGGFAFETSAVALDGNGDSGVGSVWVNLTVFEIDGDSADGVLNLSLHTPDGLPFFEIEYSINLTNGSSVNISQEIQNIPLGFFNLAVVLSGDVSSSLPSGWDTSQNYFITRLRPLSVGLADTNLWTPISFNSTGNETGSLPRDGDRLNVLVPVENLGDYNASVTFIATNNAVVLNNSNFSILADSTYMVEIALGIVDEGDLFFNVSINISGESDTSDNSASYVLNIAPPPLPLLSLQMSSGSATEAEIGDVVTFAINASNNGEVDWSGQIMCTLPTSQTLVYSANITLTVGQVWQHSLNVSASPGNLSCGLMNGGRIDDNSQANAGHFFDMVAAEFGLAGGGGLVLAGGPWHVGDMISASVLVHNSGGRSGSASLTFGSSAIGIGEIVNIEAGGSAVLSVEFIIEDSNQQQFNWLVSSLDGLVAPELSGQTTVVIAPSQSLNPSIENVVWDVDDGISFVWSIDLSTGKGRVVGVELGVIVDGEEDVRQSYSLLLESGKRQVNSQIGSLAPQGEVFVRLVVNEWQNSGTNIAILEIPSARPSLSIAQSEIPTPPRPDEASSALVNCELSNSGDVASSAGVLHLTDSSGLILDEVSTDPIPAGGQENQQMTVENWPGNSVVDLNCRWLVGEEVLTAEQSYLSGAMLVDDSGSFEMPWSSIGIGAVIAVVITIISRLAYTWKKEGDSELMPTKSSRSSNSKKSTSSLQSSSSNPTDVTTREVKCSACSQRLAVPETFSGTARCPACKHQFPVEAVVSAESTSKSEDSGASKDFVKSIGLVETEDRNEGDIDSTRREEKVGPISDETVGKKEASKELEVFSKGDILPCPTCASKLRVSLDKRPAKARCPACKTEFMARKG